jgi:hypothetical protein
MKCVLRAFICDELAGRRCPQRAGRRAQIGRRRLAWNDGALGTALPYHRGIFATPRQNNVLRVTNRDQDLVVSIRRLKVGSLLVFGFWCLLFSRCRAQSYNGAENGMRFAVQHCNFALLP